MQQNPNTPDTPIIINQPFNDTFPRNTYSGPKPIVLLILDGWGIGPNYNGNAIIKAHTPNLDSYWIAYPHTQLEASGEAVGLTHGTDGNTETGHLNIGAGTIVYQYLPRINTSIADGSFFSIKAFHNAFNHVRKNNSTLHIMGLIGSGGVHSNIEHLYALLNLCKKENIKKVYIHGFTDGRDSPPTTGINYVQQIMNRCKKLGLGKIATLMGRYYAMDRDKKWDRIEKAYNAMTIGTGRCTIDPLKEIQLQYDNNITDEFIEPINVCDEDGTHRVVQDNDAVIFFNYRIDRPREITRAFVMPNFEQGIVKEDYDPYYEKYNKTSLMETKPTRTFQRKKIIQNLFYVTMTEYEKNLPVEIAFPRMKIKDTVGRTLATHGLRQLRITETEKQRFVTKYLNGQMPIVYPGESRVIFHSKGVKSYDQVPEMRAYEIGNYTVESVAKDKYDVIIANICNGDMVGHTGNLQAGIQACEHVDKVVGQIVNQVSAVNGITLITADHGNVEEMINAETGQPDTEHSTYPVPFIVVGNQYRNNPKMLHTGILADIAPTLLHLLGIPKAETMTGRILI